MNGLSAELSCRSELQRTESLRWPGASCDSGSSARIGRGTFSTLQAEQERRDSISDVDDLSPF